MLTIEWLYLYIKGPVSGLGKWTTKDTSHMVWFTITSNDYLIQEQEKDIPEPLTFISKEDMKKMGKEQKFQYLADTFAAEQARRAKNKKKTNRQYYLYLLDDEQVENLNKIYYEYCENCGIKPGYIRDNLLTDITDNFCNKQNLSEVAATSDDSTVELKFNGLTKSKNAQFNIILPELEIWSTIEQSDIVNFYPQ